MASEAASLVNTDEEQDDYYAILGVPVTATPAEIKKAYYKVMREFHPDLSNDDVDTTEFCVFLNEVYETLSDPDRRSVYDTIVGLATTGVNPFADKSYEADKVFVDEYTCIGCRNCAAVCSRTFEMEEEFGRARATAQGKDSDEKLQEAIDTCPVNCIYWVTAPQLSLLENEMRRMERKNVWLLMNGGGSAISVFLEASNTWEKRRAAARARADVEKARGMWAGFRWQPSATASSYGAEAEAEEWQAAGERRGMSDEVRRKTAASVAAAARRWRDLRRNQRRERVAVGLLGESVDDE